MAILVAVCWRQSAATASTKNEVITTKAGKELIFDLADAPECTRVSATTADSYGNFCKYALAAEIAKLQTGLTADDVDITDMTCATAKLTVKFTIFIKNAFASQASDVVTALKAITAANLGTAIKAAYKTATDLGMTAVTVTDPAAQLDFDAPVEVAGQAKKITQTLKFTFADAKQVDCTNTIKDDAAGRQGIAKAVATIAPKTLQADISYATAPTCPATSAPFEGIFPLTILGKRTATKGRKAELDAMPMGTAAATDPSIWKQVLADATSATELKSAPVISVAAAETTQAAAKTVSGTVEITMADYADCNKLKGSFVMTQIKEYIKGKTGSLMSNIVATVSCAATKASLYIMITSPILLGNTLSAEVKTKLDAITTWGADIKTQADFIKDITLTTSTRTTAVVFTEADPVAAQAKDAVVSGEVLYTVSNRADCEDVKSKESALKAELVKAAGAATDSSNSVMISCVDVKTTMKYKLKVAKAATTTDQMIINTLNGMDDAAWKKIVTDALATTTAVTLEGAYSTTTITAPTTAELTTTTTGATTTGTAAPYVAMSKVVGAYTVKGTESECLNMKDQKAAIASLIKTKSTVNTAGSVSVELACAKDTGATTWTATITYTIMFPTDKTPTGEAIVTALKAVTAAKWITDVQTEVGKPTDVPAPTTLASWTTKTEPAASAVTTTLGPTTTYTGSTTMGTAKTITGKLEVKVGSLAECQKMADANGIAALKEMLKTATGGVKTTDMTVGVTCARRRRLSDGRRLSATATATVAYTIQVAATAAIPASTISNNLKAIDNAAWATKVTTALKNAATPVTLTGVTVTKTDPSTTTVHNVSSGFMVLMSPLVGLMVVLQFLV